MRKGAVLILLLLICSNFIIAQSIPSVSINIKDSGTNKGGLASTIKIALLFTFLALTPAILMLMTAFTRIIISFHFLRQAMGTQGVPPNQVLIGLALFLTIFVMSPVAIQINKVGIEPYNKGEITEMEALKRASVPVKKFMLRQTREKDLALFYKLSKKKFPNKKEDVSMITLIPSFVLSELKTAFQIGFLLYIPFLIIDVIVASILVSLGMIFLPPIMVSLPFKIVLFILADGWFLLTGSLLRSFGMGG